MKRQLLRSSLGLTAFLIGSLLPFECAKAQDVIHVYGTFTEQDLRAGPGRAYPGHPSRPCRSHRKTKANQKKRRQKRPPLRQGGRSNPGFIRIFGASR